LNELLEVIFSLLTFNGEWKEKGMYKTILVPLDGSKRAEAILPYVEDLGYRYKSKIVFMQVVTVEQVSFSVGITYPNYYQDLINEAENKAEVYLAGIKGEFVEKGIKACGRIVHGPVVDAIINAAESEGADLIAIASHGRGGLTRAFYGSIAAGVLHRIDRPLLLIRSRRG
jgi:nucleotide-binding universal stress UspA family protein